MQLNTSPMLLPRCKCGEYRWKRKSIVEDCCGCPLNHLLQPS